MSRTIRSVTMLIITLLLVLPIKQSALSTPVAASGQAQQSRITVDFQTIVNVPLNLQVPIELAVNANEVQLSQSERFIVSALRHTESWMYAVLLPAHTVEAGMEAVQPDHAVEILGHLNPNGQWDATIFGSPHFLALAREVPSDFMDLSDRFKPVLTATLNFLFPWTTQQSWYKTQGWHLNFTNSPNYNAMDFQPVNRSNPDVDYAVLADEAGRLDNFCSDRNDQAWLKITHPDGQVSVYGHIQASTIPQGLFGQQVQRGQLLGRIYTNGSIANGFQTPCGWGTGGHLHFVLPTRNMRINGYWANDVSNAWNATQYRSTNARTDAINQIAVGQNSSRQDVFQRAYDLTRSGTVANITYGTTTNGAYWYSGLVRQDFSSGVSLIHDEGADLPIRSIPAYPIYGAIKSYWEANFWLGAPTTNQFRNSVGQQEQHFRAGLVLSGGALSNTWADRWGSSCANGLWRLEVVNLSDLGNSSWPPAKNLTAGPSSVVCVSTSKSGYAFFYDVGTGPAAAAHGIESDHWIARLSGKISGLPVGTWPARAACDDGCDIQINTANVSWLTQRIVSWQDQPASSLNPLVGVRNGDDVSLTLYEHGGLARAWLKLGLVAILMPPLAAMCDASIAIADGAPMINTLTPTLTLSATNAVTVGIGFKADLSDAVWQPYTTTLPLQLASSSSIVTRTVYAQFLDDTAQPICQGAILETTSVLDMLPPTGTATIASNDAVSVTLQLDASDQTDGSGVEVVAFLPITPGQPTIDPATLPEEAWQAYSTSVNIPKPMAFADTDPTAGLTYQVWFRDAVGNIAAPLTVTVPYVAAPVVIQKVFLPLLMR